MTPFDSLLLRIDPFSALLVLGVVALYIDSRTDRRRYLEILKETTQAIQRITDEIEKLGQRIK